MVALKFRFLLFLRSVLVIPPEGAGIGLILFFQMNLIRQFCLIKFLSNTTEMVHSKVMLVQPQLLLNLFISRVIPLADPILYPVMMRLSAFREPSTMLLQRKMQVWCLSTLTVWSTHLVRTKTIRNFLTPSPSHQILLLERLVTSMMPIISRP